MGRPYTRPEDRAVEKTRTGEQGLYGGRQASEPILELFLEGVDLGKVRKTRQSSVEPDAGDRIGNVVDRDRAVLADRDIRAFRFIGVGLAAGDA